MIIEGKNIDLRLVTVNDAEFILSLRLDPALNAYLSPVEDDIEKQRAWIRNCLQKNKEEWYFIIQNKKGKPVGTVRIYDIQEDSFCWGSWIVKPEARYYASVESAILLYQYAFNDLGFTGSHFYVRKNNKEVISFHLKLGAEIIREDDLNVFFIFRLEDFLAKKDKYSALINRIKVV